MRILIISDTHGRFSAIEDLFARVGKPDMLIHCGDVAGDADYVREMAGCETHIVRGNCDFDKTLPSEELIFVGDHKILVTHGHKYRVYYGLECLKEEALNVGADIVLYGHTHVPYTEYGDVCIANPGSLAEPRQPGRRPSYMFLEFDRYGHPFFAINYIEEK